MAELSFTAFAVGAQIDLNTALTQNHLRRTRGLDRKRVLLAAIHQGDLQSHLTELHIKPWRRMRIHNRSLLVLSKGVGDRPAYPA